MFEKHTANGAMQAARAILSERTRIKAAITAAEVELSNAQQGRLYVLKALAVSEAERALLAEPGTGADVGGGLRAATERVELASARIAGLKGKLEGTDIAVIEAKAQMESAHGEYALSQMADAVKVYAKLADVFLAGLRRLSAAAEALGVTYISSALREVVIPDMEHIGYGVNLSEPHWGIDPKAAAVYEQHAPVMESLRLISTECSQVEATAIANVDSQAKWRQQEIFDARKANGSASVGQVNMPASARLFV